MSTAMGTDIHSSGSKPIIRLELKHDPETFPKILQFPSSRSWASLPATKQVKQM
jgi:hypothetical protein